MPARAVTAAGIATDLGDEPGFRVIPKRWIVEWIFSWLGRQRRLSKDDERLTGSAETFIYLVGIRLLLSSLVPSERGRLFEHFLTHTLAPLSLPLCSSP